MADHFEHVSILPKQATPLEMALERINIKRLNSISFVNLWDWQNCPLAFLPYLAWATGVFYWNDDWSEKEKRETCRRAILNGRKMGSLNTLKDVLKVAGYGDAIVIKALDLPKTDQDFKTDNDNLRTIEAPDHWAMYWIIIRKIITPQKAALLRKLAQSVSQAHAELVAIQIENVGITTDMNIRTNQGWATDGSFKEVA